MNSKTKILFICFCAMILLFIPFYFSKTYEIKKCIEKISALEYQITASDFHQIDHLKMYSIIYNNYFNNRDYIQEVLDKKTSVLIYRFSKYICESCINDDLKEIELLQKETGRDKIMLFPYYPNDRNGKIELSNLLSKFNYRNLPFDTLIIPSQDGDFFQRYFAVIDKDGNITMVFFPQRENRKLMKIYFSEVKKELEK